MNSPIDTRALRAAAAIYLLLVVTSIIGVAIPQTLVVSGNAAATAHNLLVSETLFRVSLVLSLVAAVSFVFLVRQLYQLLSPVSESLASLMVTLVLVSIPIAFVGVLTSMAALQLVHGGAALSGLSSGQRDSLAMFSLGLGDDVSSLNSIFFGLWLLPFGLLMTRSGFIPRIVGYLVLIAAVAYPVGSLNVLLAPPFSSTVSSIVTIGYIGELAAVIWLLIAAVRPPSGIAVKNRPLEVRQS